MTPGRDPGGREAAPASASFPRILAARLQRLLAAARPRLRLLYQALGFLLLVELLMVAVAPLLIPDSAYLRLYLGRRAKENAARFLADSSDILQYDPVVGWRNRPNVDKAMWRTDSLGSRSAHPISRARSGRTRLLFLGGSLINGGTDVAASETISAFVEDSATEAINFGTMMHSLDQMYLAYRSELYRYEADVIVVGLPGDPGEGLTSRYIPFRYRSEKNMPFLKPRFEMTDTGPALVPVPSRDVYARMLETGEILDSLRSTDAHYGTFARFRRFGLTPLARGMWHLYEHARNLGRLVAGADPALALSVTLMRRFEDEARSHGARVVFMLLPLEPLAYPPLWRRWLPDTYARTASELRRHGFTLLDGRHVLRTAYQTASDVYIGEDYTPAGNRAIAMELRRLLRSGEPAEADGSPE